MASKVFYCEYFRTLPVFCLEIFIRLLWFSILSTNEHTGALQSTTCLRVRMLSPTINPPFTPIPVPVAVHDVAAIVTSKPTSNRTRSRSDDVHSFK